ncbi:hypothetical protein LINGRAHAP2_LOCUS2918 [Linum grandiflorum]
MEGEQAQQPQIGSSAMTNMQSYHTEEDKAFYIDDDLARDIWEACHEEEAEPDITGQVQPPIEPIQEKEGMEVITINCEGNTRKKRLKESKSRARERDIDGSEQRGIPDESGQIHDGSFYGRVLKGNKNTICVI